MDLLLLRAVVSEADDRLSEQELLRFGFLGRHRYVLRFATSGRDNLFFSVRPDLPRLHLTPHGLGLPEAPGDRFASLVDRELAGARLLDMRIPGEDRVVEMRFRIPAGAGPAAERMLVVELFGRSANALLLDGAGTVLAFARDLHSAFRAPVVGSAYQPPRPLSAGTSGARTIADVAPASTPGRAAAPRSITPIVYSIRPLDELREGMPIKGEDLQVMAAPLDPPPRQSGSDEPLVATRFGGASEAVQAGLDLLERLRDFEEERVRHQGRVRAEVTRLLVLERRLGQDLAGALGSDRDRRRAEALLAGLGAAKVTGTEVTVPDPESAAGHALTIPIDPAISLAENAQRLFARWKKGKRAVSTIETRLAITRDRLEAWRALESRVATATSQDDLLRLRGEMEGLGLVHAERRSRRSPPVSPREPPTRVRRHLTTDGFVVLVGRSGPENDTLTFRVAAPSDFWLHAAGTPGAHVVVRNPQRLKTLPEPTLRAAAAIAAWYSGAKGEGKVEVHYTQRKHVHKRRGSPAGQVLVRRFRSLQVAPRLPQPAIEDV